MVTGWFLSIRELRVGMREPREPRTLPNRTDLYEPEYEVANQDVSPSAIDFDLPSALMGSAALSVEMLTNVLTPLLREAESPWVCWRFHTLETRMESWTKTTGQVGGIRLMRKLPRFGW